MFATVSQMDFSEFFKSVYLATGVARFSHLHMTLYEGLSFRPPVHPVGLPFLLNAKFKPKRDPAMPLSNERE